MSFPAAILFCALPLLASAADVRTWTDRQNRTFTGELVAADGLRATLSIEGRGKVTAPLASLSQADADYIREWRRTKPRAPLIDPSALAPWPAEAAADSLDVKAVAAEEGGHGQWRWESAHFSISSDIDLPIAVVRDLAGVFEGTRAAVIAAPIGIHGGVERSKYPVRLFSRQEDYAAAGGPEGSGGFYARRLMLILLPNIGIAPGTRGLGTQHQRHLFVLKHEVTHQLVSAWIGRLPQWLNEGLPEIFASAPYARGRYTFRGMDGAMRDYVLKWRPGRDARSIRLIPARELMSLSQEDWNRRVAAQDAYDLYNSAALLTHYFLWDHGKRDGAALAAYLAALRQGTPPLDAEKTHLIPNDTRDSLDTQVRAMAKRIGIAVQ